MLWYRTGGTFSKIHGTYTVGMRLEEILGSNLFLEYLNAASKIKYIQKQCRFLRSLETPMSCPHALAGFNLRAEHKRSKWEIEEK